MQEAFACALHDEAVCCSSFSEYVQRRLTHCFLARASSRAATAKAVYKSCGECCREVAYHNEIASRYQDSAKSICNIQAFTTSSARN